MLCRYSYYYGGVILNPLINQWTNHKITPPSFFVIAIVEYLFNLEAIFQYKYILSTNTTLTSCCWYGG